MDAENREPPRTRPRQPRLQLEHDVIERITAVIERGKLNAWYGGEVLHAFEDDFAARFGRRRAVACNSGTSALHLAYTALGIEPGTEVLIPGNAYVSAASAALQCDLIPVFVDIDPYYWAMDPEAAAAKITSRTSAMVVVHMYGQPCDVDRLLPLAESHGLAVVEDAAAAHGATWRSRPIGSFGLLSCFSVCCFKLVTAGEGGLVATDDYELADLVRSLAHKGKGMGFFEYLRPGFSYHMSEVQAAIAHASLHHMDQELDRRTANAEVLRRELPALDVAVQPVDQRGRHGLFKLPLLLNEGWPDADILSVAEALAREGVPVTAAHPYLLDIPWLRERRHPAFGRAGTSGTQYDPESCPNARRLIRRQLSVDVGPGLDEADMHLIVEAFARVASAIGKGVA